MTVIIKATFSTFGVRDFYIFLFVSSAKLQLEVSFSAVSC